MGMSIEVGQSGTGGAVGALTAGLICIALAGVGLHVAIFGGEISGGIPFAPAALNQGLGRLMFGAGGLLTLGLAFWAFTDALRKLRRSRSTVDDARA